MIIFIVFYLTNYIAMVTNLLKFGPMIQKNGGKTVNYIAAATDAGACTYAVAGYDCDGACWVDSDGDTVCDPFEVVG